MKRLHVHVHVEDLQRSIGFYAALFAAEPTVRKPDYAKWLLDDPAVNFAISARGRDAGVSHLGFQLDDGAELREGVVPAGHERGRVTRVDLRALTREDLLALLE